MTTKLRLQNAASLRNGLAEALQKLHQSC